MIYRRRLKKYVDASQQDRGVVIRRNKPALVAVDRSDSEEIMTIATSPSATERDLRLDFFRGLALFCMFIDHMPNNILADFTLQSMMFSDAAEVFILISGYTAGMVYGRAMERQGFLVAGVRVYHRVWQLYVAHVFLFMMFMATVAYTVGALNNSLYAEEFGAANFLNEPGLAVLKALTLQFQPAFMDILPLYIVLLAVLPFVLAGFRSWPGVVIFVSRCRPIPALTEYGFSIRSPGKRCSSWGHGSAGGALAVGFPGSAVAGCSGSRRASHWPDS